MNSYNELYVNDAMSNLGNMVDYAINILKYDPDEFWNMFVDSGVAEQIEKGNPTYLAGMSGIELAHFIIRKIKGDIDYEETLLTEECSKEYWAGWILAYYQWKTSRRFKDMIRDGLKLSTVLNMYILHEADVSKFVQSADEIIQRNAQKRKSNLQIMRVKKEISQSQLAKRAEVSLRMVQLYEQRQNNINKAQAIVVWRLSKALDCQIEDLFEEL